MKPPVVVVLDTVERLGRTIMMHDESVGVEVLL